MRKKPDKSEKKKEILVVDDEIYFLKACKRFLGDEFIVYLCSSGKIALDILKLKRDFDAIFLDLSIPDISGIKIFQFLKSNDSDLTGKVVFMTGGVLDKETQRFLDGVKNTKLEKPFDLELLLQSIPAEKVPG